MTSILDDFFEPRGDPKPVKPPAEGVRPWAANLAAQGATVKPPRKRRDPNKPTPKQLRDIGEGLTKYIFNRVGVKLRKIEQIEGWGGYWKSVDVDYANDAHRVKVEAKTWWTKHGKNSFALSRVSDKERRYMARGPREGFRCYMSIALLDGDPTRKACQTFYVIPWGAWMQIEAELLQRAAGNYKGKSLRVKDLDLLDGFAIVRNGTRWQIPPSHWLTKLTKHKGGER